MRNYRQSIRLKIMIGYYVIVSVIVGLSILTFIDLHFLEKRIISADVVSEFFDATLEIRRFEKNYFLYRQGNDYFESLTYVNRAQELLDANAKSFAAIADLRQVEQLRAGLKEYRELMEKYKTTGSDPSRPQDIRLEKQIRETGKEIITISEDMSLSQRKYMQRTLSSSRSVLIISFVLLSALVIGIGQVLSRMIVKPLKMLEKSMEMIAEGKFETIHIDSKDREIISLSNAFTKMLKELELRQRHLVQSEKLASLGTLLSGVAHELNNPLSNISTSCQILTEEIEDDDLDYKKELLGQIDGQTDRARNIVRSLLEFSRDRDFKKEELSLKMIFEETIRFVKGQVPTNVEIRVDVPDEITLFADKQRLQQAFLNLIKNAIEAIPDEGQVIIEARRHSAIEKADEDSTAIYNYLKYHGKCTLEEDTVDIRIKDTGSGIPPEVLPKVFDPFFTTKDVGKGSGLGLSIVHEIIEEHNGCIAVDSTPGEGTTFLIRLPLSAKENV